MVMAADAVPHLLTTVLARMGQQIHLGPTAPAANRLTLCGQPVAGRVSAQRFHRLGCIECATYALDRGITSIEDLNHTSVNLPRFIAARESLESTMPPILGPRAKPA
jgi:hypothetical protein